MQWLFLPQSLLKYIICHHTWHSTPNLASSPSHSLSLRRGHKTHAMAPNFIHAISTTLVFFIFLPKFQATSTSTSTSTPPTKLLTSQTCPYPCIPPPIPTTSCPPPPLLPLPPPPPPMTILPPELPLIPPPPGTEIWAAPPPPNPILPYFPWYYKYPPPPPNYSSAMSLGESMLMAPCIILVVFFFPFAFNIWNL